MRTLLRLFALGTLSTLAACTSQIGRGCGDHEPPCPNHLLCVLDYDDEPVCTATCTEVDATCADGALCLDTTSGERACWLGGPVSLGGACVGHFDCAHGGICILVEGEPQATCWPACTPGRPNDCLPNEQCFPTIDGFYGYCVPVP